MNKRTACLRRAKRTRKKIRELGKPRLTVHRTAKHIYAQLIVEKDGLSQVLAAASTAEKVLQGDLKGNKVEKAKLVGKTVAERILKAGVKEVAFDRSGFKFHGRIKALAEAAREVGVIF